MNALKQRRRRIPAGRNASTQHGKGLPPIAAPTLLHYEMTNALYQYQRCGFLSAETVRLAQDAALALPLTFYGDVDLHRSAVRLAQRLALSATFDAYYLVVAERLGAELWTADRRLFRAAKDEVPWVRLVTP